MPHVLNNINTLLPPPKKEVMFLVRSVCLSVCPSDYSQTCERILIKKFWRGRACLKDQVIQFWWRSRSRFGSGSPKSEIQILRIGVGLWSLSISSWSVICNVVIVTSADRRRLCFRCGLFVCLFVCLSVCLSVRRITRKPLNRF